MPMINDNGELNAEYFGAIGDGSVSPAAMMTACQDIWGEILNTGRLARFRGLIVIENSSFPWRQAANPVTLASLTDAKYGGIIVDGPGTVFKTISTDGADVFQLNGIKNFRVLGFPTLTGALVGASPHAHGSNGCSVTGGYENLFLEISPTNCARVDKGYADGGKGLTIQCDNVAQQVGYLRADVHAQNCVEGFGFETKLVECHTKATHIDVNVRAKGCYNAVKIVSPEASGPLRAGITSGVKVVAQSMDCQKDLVLNRVHGISVDIAVKPTKGKAACKVAPDGAAWVAGDNVSEALYMAYAKNANIRMTGDKGECDYRARIGGTSAGLSGLGGATQWCNIDLDLGGVASGGDIVEIDYGGNTMRDSCMRMSKSTAADFPYQIALPVNANTLTRY